MVEAWKRGSINISHVIIYNFVGILYQDKHCDTKNLLWLTLGELI